MTGYPLPVGIPRKKVSWHLRAIRTGSFIQPSLTRLLLSKELRSHSAAIEFDEVVAGENRNVAVLLVAVGDEYRRTNAACIESIVDYCARHSYTLKLVQEPVPAIGRTIPWLRIPALMRLMELGYSRIWHVDADIVITNPRIRLGPMLRKLGPEDGYRFSLYCTVDGARNINLGSMFWSNCAASKLLLDLIYRNTKAFRAHPWAENASFIDLWSRFPEVRSITRLEFHHRVFNAYPALDRPLAGRRLLVHFAGLRGADLTAAVERFSALRALPARGGPPEHGKRAARRAGKRERGRGRFGRRRTAILRTGR